MRKVKTPYFQKDEVPLKFKIKTKEKGVILSSASVSVFNPVEEVIHDSPCEIWNDEVSFVIPSFATEYPGNYRAEFKVNFTPNITRTHIKRFHIAEKVPTTDKKEDLVVVPIDEKSSDYQVTIVVAQATRGLRRAGVEEAARIARDLAENMISRKLE